LGSRARALDTKNGSYLACRSAAVPENERSARRTELSLATRTKLRPPSLQTKIVAFSPAAYPTFTQLWNEAYPELKRTELEMRLFDMSLGPQASSRRWVAEHDGTVVGFGASETLGDPLQDTRYQLHLFVLPEHRGRGIGSSLYERVIAESNLTGDSLFRAWARQDREESLRFLTSRGFSEEMRTLHSSLDTSTFDLSRLERYLRRLEKHGYAFQRFDELGTDPQRNAKVHELFCEVTLDIPAPEPPKLPSLEEFEQKTLRSPELFSAYFVARHHRSYVGLCILLPQGRDRHELYADTLGIKRAYRGRGIAQALSYKGIEHAKTRGYSVISADSFIQNHRIGALLERLGFGNKTVWTLFSKLLQSV
jgi:GNAT superfamily N-acetyltransferase